MTDHTTLIERLRAVDHSSVEDCFCQSTLYSLAADALEASQAEADARVRQAVERAERAEGLARWSARGFEVLASRHQKGKSDVGAIASQHAQKLRVDLATAAAIRSQAGEQNG